MRLKRSTIVVLFNWSKTPIEKGIKMSIEKGSVVTLKSGGPRMTVKLKYESNDCVDCQWFRGDKYHEALQSGNFSTEQLILVKDEDCEQSPILVNAVID